MNDVKKNFLGLIIVIVLVIMAINFYLPDMITISHFKNLSSSDGWFGNLFSDEKIKMDPSANKEKNSTTKTEKNSMTKTEKNHSAQTEKNHSSKTKNNSDVKTILYWNKPTWTEEKMHPSGNKPFSNCKFKNCYVTDDRLLFPLSEIDAIVWRFDSRDRSLPILQNPATKLIFYTMESPSRFLNLQRAINYNDIFHWTMTYRTNADIDNRYGSVVRRKTEINMSKNYHGKKKKMAAWFVSNCKNVPSGRERLVESLQDFITVDIYGKCGSFTCARTRSNKCYEKMAENYFFYLSFENSLCKDYLTEKVFNILNYDVIPVVLGLGPYREHLPPKSYIDVFDFPSVEDLTDYLQYLTQNVTAYNEYFRWKSKYRTITMRNGLCNLCEKMNLEGKSDSKYKDIAASLVTSACITASEQPIDQFIAGEKLEKPVSIYLRDKLWKNETISKL